MNKDLNTQITHRLKQKKYEYARVNSVSSQEQMQQLYCTIDLISDDFIHKI